jgi:pimeloyl-ACP methyl ester carboxylesterase
MGGSDHRPRYSLDGFVAEAFGVAEAEGLFDADVKPVFVAHSFGGFPLMGCAERFGERLRAAVMVDTPVRTPEQEAEHRGKRRIDEPSRPHRIYATLDAALARFRFAPEQSCDTLYIADFIARTSLREVEGGWTWKFDPFLWSEFRIGETGPMLSNVRCPFALVWGDRSRLMPRETTDHMRRIAPAGSPAVVVPDAAHHVMVDQPLAFVAALRGLLAAWPGE